MAHERLSPRQKMIGMMYLVLTAMLALNVSKEAVEAFKKVDQGLTKTIANYVAKNGLTYQEFDKAAALNAAKAGPFRDKAYEVKQRADELFDYIQDLKIQIITEAEGPETPAVKGREVIIEEVKKIDENNVPSQILIGADENGKANNLKALIASYRDDMIKLVNGKNISIEESLKKIFDTNDGLNKSGEKERWENLNFQALPLVAVITILSKMQVDVRNAETDILNFLYEQIDKRSFKFNRIIPMVMTKSTYVMSGNEYDADIFISAADTTQAPTIMIGQYKTTVGADGTPTYEMVGNYATLPVDETGKGKYKVRAGAVGPVVYTGLIKITAPDGTVQSYPFKGEYAVGEPNVVVSPTAMNVLYAGIDNPIDISVPGVGNDKVRVTMKNGNIIKGKVKNSKGEFFPGEYMANPPTSSAGQIAEINVSAEMAGKVQSFPARPFRIKPVPKPTAAFANVSGEATVTKAELMANQMVFANLEGFDFDLKFRVTEFRMTIIDKGFDVPADSKSNRLTDEQKANIARLTNGKKLYVERIKAVGPDNKPQDLAPIIITVK